jgi:hypothetical protein
MPCRGIGIGGNEIHELVAGSYASTARNAPTSSLLAAKAPHVMAMTDGARTFLCW